jgi:hypothetical protein
VEEETARRCAGVNGVGEALKLDALLVQLANKINQVLNATAKSTKFPDDKLQAISR